MTVSTVSNSLSKVPRIPTDVDSLRDLPFIPADPLPKKSFAMYIVGSPGSGKSNLIMALLLSHPTKKRPEVPKYYFKYFDHVELISGSLQTLPRRLLSKLPEEQEHNQFSDELLTQLIDHMRSGGNQNNLIILDDCVRDLKRSKTLAKVFLNRRHCTHDASEAGHGGLSIMTTSQKYTLLPLEVRVAQSHVLIFRSSNSTEINRVKEELMADLSSEEQDAVLQLAWSEPHSFLLIAVNEPKELKYFRKFDRIKFSSG